MGEEEEKLPRRVVSLSFFLFGATLVQRGSILTGVGWDSSCFVFLVPPLVEKWRHPLCVPYLEQKTHAHARHKSFEGGISTPPPLKKQN